MELFFYVLATLFSVINPFGTVPVFVGLTQEATSEERQSISAWTSFYTLLILLISFFLGKYLLIFFNISIDALRIGGGMIIVSSGFALLTGKFSKHKGMSKSVKMDVLERKEISLTPLAIPMLAGPGSISLLISLNQQYSGMQQTLWACIAILTVCLLTFIILSGSGMIVKALGASGLNALSRIIGFIVISIGIEYIQSSVMNLFRKCMA